MVISFEGENTVISRTGSDPSHTPGGCITPRRALSGSPPRAASDAGALIVDPRRWAGPELQETYRRYPHIGPVLPALGYYAAQIEALV